MLHEKGDRVTSPAIPTPSTEATRHPAHFSGRPERVTGLHLQVGVTPARDGLSSIGARYRLHSPARGPQVFDAPPKAVELDNTRTAPRRCLFCETTVDKRTGEHVWKRSLRTRFPPVPSLTFWESGTAGEFVETRPISQFDIKLNAVCATCNAGWLNDLEARSLAILDPLGRGIGSIPTRSELHDFAFWAVTRALLRTHTSSGGHAPQYLFRNVYERRHDRQVPNGCAVLIAPTDPVDMEAGTHQSGVLDGGFIGHVAVTFGELFVSIFLGGPDPMTAELSMRAAAQARSWFPGSLWQISPDPHPLKGAAIYFAPAQARIAGACLGFMLGLSPKDQFGKTLELQEVVTQSQRGDIPWKP